MKNFRRVVCKVCVYSNGKKCTVKKVKVNQNKTRVCENFLQDISKIKVRKKLTSEYVPYYKSSKKAYKKWVAEQKEKELQESMEEKVAAVSNPDILSKFRSTAS